MNEGREYVYHRDALASNERNLNKYVKLFDTFIFQLDVCALILTSIRTHTHERHSSLLFFVVNIMKFIVDLVLDELSPEDVTNERRKAIFHENMRQVVDEEKEKY